MTGHPVERSGVVDAREVHRVQSGQVEDHVGEAVEPLPDPWARARTARSEEARRERERPQPRDRTEQVRWPEPGLEPCHAAELRNELVAEEPQHLPPHPTVEGQHGVHDRGAGQLRC